jgi:hypothetical protein
VLRPGGRMLLHTVVATDLLEVGERTRLSEAIALSPATMDRDTVEAAIAAAGLDLSTVDTIGAEWLEYDLEHDADGSHDAGRVTDSLLAVARLSRSAELRAALGGVWVERLLAFEQWRIFLLLGKLETVIYQLTAL